MWRPMGPGLDRNCACSTRPWGQQHKTINWSIRYLVTDEIEGGQTGGRTTNERVSHKLDWSLTSELKIKYNHNVHNVRATVRKQTGEVFLYVAL